MSKKRKSGQIALIILLIMIVALTVGLSVMSTSITDVQISQDEEEALRAFSAAEAGVEDILKDITVGIGSYSVNVGSLKANVEVSEVGDGASRTILSGEPFNVPLTGSNVSQVTIDWIDTARADEMDEKAALEITVYDRHNNFQRFAYTPSDRNRPGADDVDFSSVSCSGGTYHCQVVVAVNPGNDTLMRIRALGDQTTVEVSGNNAGLPLQEYEVFSQVVTEGGKEAGVTARRSLPVILPVFDYALFSAGSINK